MTPESHLRKAANLRIGETFKVTGCGYTLHRYSDGWWALWNKPKENCLGSILRTADELLFFMHGNLEKGQQINGANVC